MMTAPQCKLICKTPAGVKFAEATDFDWLTCSNVVNGAGLINAQFSDGHPVIGGLEHLSQLEVWRKDLDNGLNWYLHYQGFYIQPKWSHQVTGKFLLTGLGHLSMLDRRRIAWAAGTSNRSAFISQPAETIMKFMVDYNAGPNATVLNGRKRAGTIAGISIEADGGNGNKVDWYCFGDNLLASLHDLARVGGGDFDLYKTGAATWEFRWYTGQLGTDRSSTVIFALGLGNMGEPVYEFDRLNERTVAIVAGRGEKDDRAFVIRTGPDYAAGNDKEMFVNASNCSTTAGLNSAGDKELDEQRAVEVFTFKVLQTPGCLYGKHYFLGDLVTAVNPFTGASVIQKVEKVTLGLKENGESVLDVETVLV